MVQPLSRVAQTGKWLFSYPQGVNGQECPFPEKCSQGMCPTSFGSPLRERILQN